MKTTPLLPLLLSAFVALPLVAHGEELANNQTQQQIGSKPVTLKNVAGFARFNRSSVEPIIFQGGFFDRLKQTIEQLGEYKNLVIEVVGHSDSENMSNATEEKYGSNQKLSQLRAERTVERIKERLQLPDVTYKAVGLGATKPLRPNTSAANRAYNRRAEINISYDAPIYAPAEAPAAEVPVAAAVPVPVPVPEPVAVAVPTPAVETAPTPAPTPAPEPEAKPEHSEQAVKEALAVKADDEDGNSLKEALTAVDKNYSLSKRGEIGFSYSYSFTYSSTESLELSDKPDADSGKRYVTDISRDSRYTHRSNLSASYGLLDNLTAGIDVPIVSAHRDGGSKSDSVDDTNVGDVSVDLRWQPWETRLGKVNSTFGFSASLPTGTSPYKIDTENSVATGSGTYGFGLSASFSKIIDPVIAYGGISLSHSLPIENLNQIQGSQVLVKVEPQPSIGYSLGIGYALSYGVSLNLGFSHSFAAKTKLYYSDDIVTLAKGGLLEQELIGGHSAMANASVGFRVSPGAVMSVNLGVGLTRESPDFTVGMSLPFSFGGVKERAD